MTHSSLQYMLTLCELSAPTRIRTPDSESMRQFKFFMSRSRNPNGSEQLRLHMGYFASIADADQWARTMRVRFPMAKVYPVPLRILLQRESELTPAPVAALPTLVAPPAGDVPVMTDSQVLRVLEARRFTPEETQEQPDVRGISLVGPDDTASRRVLKDAVIQGAPVQFAVQMFESAVQINLSNVPSLSIFRHYTLYKTTVTREQRPVHSLRLGFFKDAISAKQVAYFVRSHFAAVAVVPVTETERELAVRAPIDPAALSDSFQRSIDEALQAPAPAAKPISKPIVAQAAAPTAPAPSKRRDSLEQTLELLAASEMWNTQDSLSETGVRHLKLEVQKKKSRG
jgi:hypothetical protein